MQTATAQPAPPPAAHLLADMKEAARQAHYWTSHSPEKRGDALLMEYGQILNSDLAELAADGATPEQLEKYTTTFRALFSSWLSRKAACFSWFITGPSKFPTRKADRANRSEQAASDTFHQWRARYFKKKERIARGPINPDTELAAARADFYDREKTQSYMKAVNAACRKSNAEEVLAGMGISSEKIHALLNPRYSYEGKGFPAYKLTNNGAAIRRLVERIETLEAKITEREQVRAGEKEADVLAFPGGRIERNLEADRVQIFHDQKPPQAVRDWLKKSGWNWSPSNECWQRKTTGNAIWSAREFIKFTAQNTPTDGQA